MNARPAIEIGDLRYAYPDGTVALDGVDLAVAVGERVGLIGANGAGKSTLLWHLNGLLSGQGTVRVLGMEVDKGTRGAVRRAVGLVFQNPDDQLFCPTLFDDVAFGPRNMGLSEEDVRRRVADALHAVGLDGLGYKSAFHLSIGQKKRAAIATVLSMDVEILVMDEPTSNLDPRGRRELRALLANIGATQIIATHDLDLVWDYCPRAVLLNKGRKVADGDSEEILQDHSLLEANGL